MQASFELLELTHTREQVLNSTDPLVIRADQYFLRAFDAGSVHQSDVLFKYAQFLHRCGRLERGMYTLQSLLILFLSNSLELRPSEVYLGLSWIRHLSLSLSLSLSLVLLRGILRIQLSLIYCEPCSRCVALCLFRRFSV
jgi:hypothetical protein